MYPSKSQHRKDAPVSRALPALTFDAVDNWHPAWKKVLTHVARTGRPDKLAINADGWLSSRQVLIAAIVGATPAGHVCFTVTPAKDGCIRARLESYGIDPKFCSRGIESQLHRAATERAHAFNCEKLIGFKLNSNWC